MNGLEKKVGTILDNILLIEKRRDSHNTQRMSLLGSHLETLYILDCIFDTKEQLEEFDSNILAETKIRLYYTTNLKTQGYFKLNIFVKEKVEEKIIELNFSRSENRVQYYGCIEKM